jgi:hypothetical protein
VQGIPVETVTAAEERVAQRRVADGKAIAPTSNQADVTGAKCPDQPTTAQAAPALGASDRLRLGADGR